MRNNKRLMWVAGLLTAVAPVLVRAADVSGVVATPGGKQIRAAITIHDLGTIRGNGSQAFDHTTASAPDGTFRFPTLPAGKYEFCVEAPQENVIDPCLWPEQGPRALSFAAADVVTGQAVTVRTGYPLHVRVNDPQGLLPVTGSGFTGDALRLFVVSRTGRFIDIRAVGADSGGRDYEVLIPFAEPLMLVTESATLGLSDKQGRALAGNSRRVPVIVPVGGSLGVVTINVSGK